MLSKTAAIIRDNYWFYLFFVVALAVVVGAQDAGYIKSGIGAGASVLWLLMARYAHRSALLGRKFGENNADGTPDRAFGGFIFKGLLLGIIALVLALPALVLTNDTRFPGSMNISFYLVFLPALLLTYSVVVGLLGSWLPASVHGENRGFGAAFRRGRSNFLPVFFRILALMIVTTLLSAAAVVLFVSAGFPGSIVSNGHVNIAAILLTIGLLAVQCVNVTLTSVILSHYYRQYEERAGGTVFPAG